MPGFHEDEEDASLDDMQPDEDIMLEGRSEAAAPQRRPPHSAPAPTSAIASRAPKPHSVGQKPFSESGTLDRNTDASDCPICGKTLQTDNQGFNSHLDFCLSRGAIRQAHAEAVTYPVKKTFPVSRKPTSKGKAKKSAK